jgi:hypothetical protein
VKTTPINIMVEAETKKKLLEKAKALNLSLTSYIEKIANEPVCFIDSNVQAILHSLNLKPHVDDM